MEKCLDILTDDHMFDSISEEGATYDDLKVDVVNNCWLGIYEGVDLIGVFLLRQIYSECYDVHIHILKEYRKYWMSAGKAIIEWCKQNIPNKTLHTNVPVFCKNVRYFVLSLGFKEAGVIPSVWKKNGKMNDMSIFTRLV
ncbi:MAG: DUF2824 family protein [Gammaproteobacteria bacterium]